MDKQKYFLMATAYADNELRDEGEIAAIAGLIETDPDVRREYQTQVVMKQVVKKHRNRIPTPDSVRESILSKTIRGSSLST